MRLSKWGKMKSIDFSKLKGVEVRKSRKSDRAVKSFRDSVKGKEEKALDKLRVKVEVLKKTHFFKIKSFTDISTLPEINESIHVITQQHINAFSLLFHISESEIIESALVTTYSISERSIAAFLELLDTGQILSLKMVVASGMKQLQKKRYEQLAQAVVNRPGKMVIAFIDNHTKICVLKTAQNNYVIEGSGNFSTNAKIEQYTISNSKTLYSFHSNWISEICFTASDSKRHEILK